MNKYPSNDFNKETDDAVYFYTPPFYPLDNFSAFVVQLWGREFQTAEHAYQWKKYIDSYPNIAGQIFEATSPNMAIKIANENKDKVTKEWHDNKVAIMEEILIAKIEQHEKIRRVLLETGGRTIVENSPIDSFWGIGPDGTGNNELGKLYMKLRSRLVQ
ncbi:MAG: hypothetical protein A2747_01900 [Candidatus Yonathbacteria bacterium RIFCSPHIGHO2_01_FULL_44_41]|uniref:NADAR domain-containing protein n=1 Tax=Candidatus Yonathbacteria bacterium RIFCSPHIGHO2_02_FULL_44_14 TaxID=1802724 RepID=A0A1G2S971_9BACT|nr:MAG: hypothetical protein A2747_01900 [Candidatus Yonathbacteria bacterium RIFCSPHIGHO2_01_FULL_44_41]OHA81616.1 MAG: hypothetical protein A3D51_02475 [Candidatus Yonathbacteria bacterium RIFCSPHIGHO2_02_FULL_44_14]OHA81797.1 MAG: hypothetical protein A3B06_02410 [Candidatus Yonathbacteria bacterium RIFCSPLOWO2_01_FULL_43_20]